MQLSWFVVALSAAAFARARPPSWKSRRQAFATIRSGSLLPPHAGLPVQPGGEIARKTSLKMPDCT